MPVYQEPALVPDLDVLSNLRLTQTPVEAFVEWLPKLGVRRFDLHAIVGEVPLAIIRVMDLARALAIEPDVLLLDEMTAALPADLAEAVLATVGDQRKTGRSVIFISHRLLEVGALCDRATVLRDGETVGVVDMGPGAEERIVELMLGPSTEDELDIHRSVVGREAPVPYEGIGAAVVTDDVRHRSSPPMPQSRRSTRLAASRASRCATSPRTARCATSASTCARARCSASWRSRARARTSSSRSSRARDAPRGARSRWTGESSRFRHPADAIRAGLVLVPGDRAEGLLPQRSVRENIALPYTAAPRTWGPIDMGAEKAAGRPGHRPPPDRHARPGRGAPALGRQPAEGDDRPLDRRRRRTLLCFDPTRGIDIRTKRQIYHLLRELAAAGAAVLLYTSELEEVQLTCDRAVVIFGGRVVAEMPADDADEPTLMRAAYGLGPREELPTMRSRSWRADERRGTAVSSVAQAARHERRAADGRASGGSSAATPGSSGCGSLLGALLVFTKLIQPGYGPAGVRDPRGRRAALRVRDGRPDRWPSSRAASTSRSRR